MLPASTMGRDSVVNKNLPS